MRIALLSAVSAVALVACSSEQPPAATEQAEAPVAKAPPPATPVNYQMSVDAEPVSGDAVRFAVTTNLPLPVEVMASVNLAGQKYDDTYVGYQQKVMLTQPTTTFTLDTSKAQNALPKAEYEAEVSFYPRWGAEQNKAAKGAPDLRATDMLRLAASGASAANVTLKNERQRWVMSSTNMNMPWDEQLYVNKLGPYQKSQADMSHLHDAYYFPGADMTLIVNRLKNELTIWRMGRDSS